MIYTYSRDTIESGITQPQPYALISISSPALYGVNVNPAGYSEGTHIPAHLPKDELRVALMRLQFHDIELRDIMGGDDRLASQYALYSTEDARRVAAFVRANKVDFVIHCDGGISRSQGMAHVYQLTWEALRPRVLPSKLDPKSPALFPSVTLPGQQGISRRVDKYRIRFSESGE